MLSADELARLAHAISSQSWTNHWYFYVVWFLLTVLCSAGGAYFGAYWKRRGENYATKADFDDILQQQRATTSATEAIKAEVSHGDWATREWKNLRRVKAEELLFETRKATQAFNDQGAEYLFATLRPYEDLGSRVYTLALLYFPEALVPATHFAALLNAGTQLLLDIRKEMHNEGVPLELSAVRTRRLHEVLEHRDLMFEPLNRIDEIVKKCLWSTFGLPDYEQDQAQAAALVAKLSAFSGPNQSGPAKPPPDQTP